jgi:hypothetical protein
VIKAHQHGALKMSIRSHYDFWKDIRSSATVDSPNVWKNDSMGGILISKWAVKKEFDLSKNVLRNIFG